MAFTRIQDIIDPEVLMDQISAKFPDELVLGNTDLVQVDSDITLPLPGQQVKMPFWKRIAQFADIAEGTAMVAGNVQADAEFAKVLRGGLAVEVYDTAELVSKADPVTEIATQIARRAAEYIDAKLVVSAQNSPNIYDHSAVTNADSSVGTATQNSIIKTLLTLGDNMGKLQSAGKLIMHSKVYGDLLQTGAIQNNYQSGLDVLKTGKLGTILGMPILVSDLSTATFGVTGTIASGTFKRGETVTQGTSLATAVVYYVNATTLYVVPGSVTGTPDNSHVWTGGTSGATFTASTVVGTTPLYTTYSVGPNSLGLMYQRQVMVEFDRDILLQADVVGSTVHFAPHLYGWDDTGAVKGVGGALKAEQAKSIHVSLMYSK